MIRLQQVSVCYGAAPVLESLETTFQSGGFACLIGPNGSGKSTLLRAIAGLQPYRGSICVDDMEISSMPRAVRAARIAYLPQQRPTPGIPVSALLAHGRFPHLGFSKTLSDQDRRIVQDAAAQTGVTALLDRDLSSLSGGERQRAYLAMIIAQDAPLILLDEPATFLDIRYQVELIELLRRLHERGKTILMAAHDLPQAFYCATELKVLDCGRLIADGTPRQLCDNASIRAAFGVGISIDDNPASLYGYRAEK